MRALSVRTRVTRIAVVVVAASAPAAALSASTASAAPPVPVSIQATVLTQGFSGTWQGSGAISDSGTFQRTDVHLTGSVVNSPSVGAFQAVFEFSGSQGTFTLRDALVATEDGVTGTWQMVSGTGAYDGIGGHGTSSFNFSTGTVTFSGVISKAG